PCRRVVRRTGSQRLNPARNRLGILRIVKPRGCVGDQIKKNRTEQPATEELQPRHASGEQAPQTNQTSKAKHFHRHVTAQNRLMIIEYVQQQIGHQHGSKWQPPFGASRKKRPRAERKRVTGAEIRREEARPARERRHEHEQKWQRSMPFSFHTSSIRPSPEMTSRRFQCPKAE